MTQELYTTTLGYVRKRKAELNQKVLESKGGRATNTWIENCIAMKRLRRRERGVGKDWRFYKGLYLGKLIRMEILLVLLFSLSYGGSDVIKKGK